MVRPVQPSGCLATSAGAHATGIGGGVGIVEESHGPGWATGGRDREMALRHAADAAMDCLKVSSTDDVLVITNPEMRAVADALAGAAEERTASTRLQEYPTQSRDGQEPPAEIAEAMLEASAIFAPTTYSISHTQARAGATQRGARIATMGGLRIDSFTRAIAVDYDRLASVTASIARVLTTASTARVTAAAGTDLRLDLAGRTAIRDDGRLGEPGEWGNLPAGEAYIAPVETAANGVIVFDGALAGHGRLRDPLSVVVEDGYLTSAAGAAADWLLTTLDAGGPNGRRIAELGVGTNPAARLCGEILEDEKVMGTIHLAFGTSSSIGGVNDATVHIDGVLTRPTLIVDERHTVLSEGVAEAHHAGPSRSQRLPAMSMNTTTRPYGSARGSPTNSTPAACIRSYAASKSRTRRNRPTRPAN
jgi:leucyl aminopeptidase (aminopeptidase T)